MNQTSTPTKEWLKQLPSSLLELDETPLLGFPPPFPWDKLEDGLKEIFEIENLSISPMEQRWLNQEELLKGLPDQLLAKYINVAPLDGWACFVMPEQDIQSLMSLLLKKQIDATDTFDHEFLVSFEQFLTLEALNTISHIGFDNSLSFHILSETALPQEDALCLDIQIALPEKSFIGRLILSKTFQHSWKERYANRRLDSPFQTALTEKISVFVHLEAGKVSLTPKEWKTVNTGDLLILDTCSVNPSESKGRVMLTVKGKPLFRGKLKDKSLKILEYPVYQEAETIMEEEEFEEEEAEEAEEETEVEEEEEEEEETEEEEEEEEETEEEEEEEEEPEAYEEEEEKLAEEVSAAPTEALEKISPEELPMTITVEMGRLQMSLQKLMELQPGNLLELNINPTDGVDLMVNGKRIAKGELLQIGETLGVRILDI